MARLAERRRAVERDWNSRFPGGGTAAGVRPQIAGSWDRSAAVAPVDLRAAPVDESVDPAVLWRASPLRPAIEAVEDQIRELAEDRGFVAAVMDDAGRLLWTCGGRHMRHRAEQVNFAPGGRWDEASVGTNALALALQEGRPAQVFSAEHYAAMVHGWCCFAAPLTEATTGRTLGVLDLSSTWDRAHPMALTAVRALASAAQAVLDAGAPRPAASTGETFGIRVLGVAELRREGLVVPLALRQAEVLALLALNEQGLTPEELHDQLHGEARVSLVSTKATVSHLRALLDGAISLRRYRLEAPVRVDVAELRRALRDGAAGTVARLYTGALLPASEAPGVRDWREVLEVGVRTLALQQRDPRLAERLPHDLLVQQVTVSDLAAQDPRRGWAQARVLRASRA